VQTFLRRDTNFLLMKYFQVLSFCALGLSTVCEKAKKLDFLQVDACNIFKGLGCFLCLNGAE
jgi:hypothetical protein